MQFDVNTRFITLVGTPLSQSFAARMQNAAYKAAGINMRYFYNEAGPEHLDSIIDGIRHMSAFKGAAITKPNKMAVMPLLDDLDPLCRKMGACNTVVKDDQGRLIGYNTDGIGFLRTLQLDAHLHPQGKSFFCIGAGGAARPMCFEVAHAGATSIYITDLFEEGARILVDDINASFPGVAHFVPFGEYEAARTCDVVANASGVGMGNTAGQSPLPLEFVNPDAFYFDACYNPRRTQFLLNAEQSGARVMNGLYMCLYQGVEQFELWTGQQAPAGIMRAELERAIATQRG